MSVITARGKQAKESAQKKVQTIDFKKIYIRLKDGDSVRVRLLSAEDYVEYIAHSSYEHGIYTQPCIKPAGGACALCKAADSGEEGYDILRPKKRYLFAMADIDSGEIRIFNASKGQAKTIIEAIEQYEEDLGEVAFVFKRTGNKTETTYTLNPILKLKGDDTAKFAQFEGQTVDDSLFETILQARTREQQIEELQRGGFPVAAYFDAVPTANEDTDESVPVDDSALPF